MLIRGEGLIDTVTLAFTISGKRGERKVSVTAPGGTATEDETVEATWCLLLNEMLLAAYETVRRKRSPAREAAEFIQEKRREQFQRFIVRRTAHLIPGNRTIH